MEYERGKKTSLGTKYIQIQVLFVVLAIHDRPNLTEKTPVSWPQKREGLKPARLHPINPVIS